MWNNKDFKQFEKQSVLSQEDRTLPDESRSVRFINKSDTEQTKFTFEPIKFKQSVQKSINSSSTKNVMEIPSQTGSGAIKILAVSLVPSVTGTPKIQPHVTNEITFQDLYGTPMVI